MIQSSFQQLRSAKNGTVIGVEYRIQAVDSAGNSTLSNLFSFDVRYTSDLTVTDFSDIPSVHSLNLPVGQEVKAYRLLSGTVLILKIGGAS